MLRELLLRTVDSLTLPVVEAGRTSMAAAIRVPGSSIRRRTCRRIAAHRPSARSRPRGRAGPTASTAARSSDSRASLAAEMLHEAHRSGEHARRRAARLARRAAERRARGKTCERAARRTICSSSEPAQTYLGAKSGALAVFANSRRPVARRLRQADGLIGARPRAAGKTYAMLDRAHQLPADGVDVVAGFVETHGRKETAALLDGLGDRCRRRSAPTASPSEFDREAIIARRPQVALIDELAHTNEPGSVARSDSTTSSRFCVQGST